MNITNPTQQLQKIEAELRRLGVLAGPIEAPAIIASAFGAAQMPFEQWLAKVFLPRAYEASVANAWPSRSQVGIAAIRNLDGRDEYATLVTLLCEFDSMVDSCQPDSPGR